MDALWLLLALVVAFVEGLAVGDPRKGDTLTEQIRPLLRHLWVRFLLITFWLWLGIHWFWPGTLGIR